MLLQDCLIKKIYKDHNKDILLSALSNAFQCDVTLYQYRGNVILADKLKPGRVESTEDIDLFYHNKHYKHVVPLIHTDEQYSSEVNHKDIHPKLLFNLQKQNLCSCVYQKQLPKSTGETTSYLHENTLTNTV